MIAQVLQAFSVAVVNEQPPSGAVAVFREAFFKHKEILYRPAAWPEPRQYLEHLRPMVARAGSMDGATIH